jgi:O-antigen/teichoic acid export membrane protein
MPRYGGLVLLGALTFGATLLRLVLPLFWLKRELPGLVLRRRFATRARLRELASVSSSNFLVHIAQKIVFSTDVIVVGIVLGATATGVYAVPAKLFALVFGIGTAVTSLMFPAFAELEGAGALERQRRLLLSGLRGGTAMMLLLALPLLLIPDLLIRAWIRKSGFEDAYAVMSILAAVLLVHQPIYVLTQFLIAKARQREVARVAIITTLANLGLSFVLARVWGLWGVAVSTLVTDLIALAFILPRYAAPAAGTTTGALVRAFVRPAVPAFAVAVPVLVVLARLWHPHTLVALVPLGALWTVAAGLALWWFGLVDDERQRLRRELRRSSPGPAAVVEL